MAASAIGSSKKLANGSMAYNMDTFRNEAEDDIDIDELLPV